MARGLRFGNVFRDGAALERLAVVDTVLFDKTGTLTTGTMILSGVDRGIGEDENAILALAAERGSLHPLALAIVWEAACRGGTIERAETHEEFPGDGVRGIVGGRSVAVGRAGFLQRCGMHKELMRSEAGTHRRQGRNVVFVGRDDRCIGLIAFEDPIRAASAPAVKELRAAGNRLLLVSGDDADTVRAVAQMVGIDEVVADSRRRRNTPS